MIKEFPYKKIAVIGAGTMGSGIAGQIANSGQEVLLLDLPKDEPNFLTNQAVKNLIKSDPPSLMHKDRADFIKTGNIRDDFDKLSKCDLIIEAIVERLALKKELYKNLDKVIKPECVVTSNTSTIPIRLLVEDMPDSFKKRFAITHYFNPVRYMRLLELVKGEETEDKIIEKLSEYNDKFLGKGVVVCEDKPGFLGNRVGVFALQVGMEEAFKNNLSIQEADALMGRPMGIPKTGVFGLYDLIGIDLMSDVVDTLGNILPKNDKFHDVGSKKLPIMPLINAMVKQGFTGNKGKGGFYREDENGNEFVLDIINNKVLAKEKSIPKKASIALEQISSGEETLFDLITNSTDDPRDEQHTKFCRNFIGRILGYASSLIPEITKSPQDIDDAMKLGFNWIRGPFEIMDVLGKNKSMELIQEVGLDIPLSLKLMPFYRIKNNNLMINCFKNNSDTDIQPIKLPKNSVRFHLQRKCLEPLERNSSASLYELENNLRLIEFHSKANAIDEKSVDIILKATNNHGNGIIIHNDAQHFSAGVNLNRFLKFIREEDWRGIDNFLIDFQIAVKKLKFLPVPVIGAPSGLAIGGGFEVLAHTDKIIAHSNSVLGLVEAEVGLVPGGGGVKETYIRWLNNSSNPEEAAWNTWMQIGYGKVGTSPETSSELLYFLKDRDSVEINRDYLINSSISSINEIISKGYKPPEKINVSLPGKNILIKMEEFMDKGISKGWFFPHDKTVAMSVANIIVNYEGDSELEINEDVLFDRERSSFLSLAKTKSTLNRISSLIDMGQKIRN